MLLMVRPFLWNLSLVSEARVARFWHYTFIREKKSSPANKSVVDCGMENSKKPKMGRPPKPEAERLVVLGIALHPLGDRYPSAVL
jgi:hypothetical protein